MKKNFLQDVIPANHRRSIRDIPLPPHKEKRVPRKPVEQENSSMKPEEPVSTPQNATSPDSFEKNEQVFDPQNFNLQNNTPKYQETPNTRRGEYEDMPPKKTKNKKEGGLFKKAVLGVLVGVLVFAGFMLSRTQATVTIDPKQDLYDVDVSIPTNVSSVATKTQVTKSASVSLEATSEQQVEKQATGRIKIINYHQETPQELVKNTRFQTPEGLIYQIRESIEIPGYTIRDGKTVPGTLEVDVYASSAGEEYNIGKTKFTIPGFQGREQFEKITAESLTEMTGGFIGIKKVVSDSAIEESEEKLRDDLLNQFSSEPSISDTVIILPDPETISYSEIRDEVNGNTVTLSLTATVDAYSFKKDELFDFVGQNTIGGSTTSDAFTLDPSGLNFMIEEEEIAITGQTQITWVTDLEELKSNLAGKKRSEISTIINSYNSFSSASMDLKPFWKTKFPEDTTKIKVEIAN